MRRLFFSVLAIFLLCGEKPLSAGTELAGATSGSFFKIGSSARPMSLGQAYVGLADDVAALSYNPAGLGLTRGVNLQVGHTAWFQGASAEHLNAAFPMRLPGRFGISLNYLSFPSQTITSQIANTPDPLLNYRVDGEFSPYDFSAALAYADSFFGGIQWGLALKAIQEKPSGSAGDGSSGILLDLGVLGETPVPGLRLGASLQNLGPSVDSRGHTFGTGVIIRSGASYRPPAGTMLFSGELDFPNDGVAVAAAGFEFGIGGILFPRAGLRWDGIFNPWSVGAGLRYKSLCLDLATVPMGDLGQTYRVSVEWDFELAAPTPPAPVLEKIEEPAPEPEPASTADTGIQEIETAGPILTVLEPGSAGLRDLSNAPEPMKGGGTYFMFTLSTEADIKIQVFQNGQLLRTLLAGHFGPGENKVFYDGLDDQAKPLANGNYEVRLNATGTGINEVRQGTFSRIQDQP
ncbi:MAG: PorV/PorQ family protein [candidate division FCPU426 bacterium]